ncbi:prepilin-type N-terminal cleavage/methylation domain-containing protein [Pseudoalteromonas sp. TB64]|uniref:type II secretion system protein n=1 Tax=Pseudoalteromonas sp. TB64 TaxID=1938600 RepID=UPI0004250420|nr:prepilin-type N-terminal cleavage/methylation domain-containing protein [Pseudoalteromonas sp. TB64]
MQKFKGGFTLIELMVVMAIVALLIGLVGPMTIQQLDKAQAKAELLNLKRELVAVSQRAFFSGQQLTVKLSGKEFKVYKATLETPLVLYSKTFKYVFFQPQEMKFQKTGFVDTSSIKVKYRDESLDIELEQLINKPYKFDETIVDY